MDTQISKQRSKTVKIGQQSFEIPVNMDKASMVECWQSDSQALETAARAILEHSPKFAWEIVSLYLHEHHYVLTSTDDPGYILRVKIARKQAEQFLAEERRAARRKKS
jgi:hypothetical protein